MDTPSLELQKVYADGIENCCRLYRYNSGVARDVCLWLRHGDWQSAVVGYQTDADKLHQYPVLYYLLEKILGCRTHGIRNFKCTDPLCRALRQDTWNQICRNHPRSADSEMPRGIPTCGDLDCGTSSDIAENLSYGKGHLDHYGFWQFPCRIRHEEEREERFLKYPEERESA